MPSAEGSMIPEYRHCQVCKQGCNSDALIKYSVRHYAHPECAMKKWGSAFFDRLTPWQCAHRFPYLVAAKAGHSKALEARAALDRS